MLSATEIATLTLVFSAIREACTTTKQEINKIKNEKKTLGRMYHPWSFLMMRPRYTLFIHDLNH